MRGLKLYSQVLFTVFWVAPHVGAWSEMPGLITSSLRFLPFGHYPHVDAWIEARVVENEGKRTAPWERAD